MDIISKERDKINEENRRYFDQGVSDFEKNALPADISNWGFYQVRAYLTGLGMAAKLKRKKERQEETKALQEKVKALRKSPQTYERMM